MHCWLTLPVDSECIEQLGAAQLSAEQGYIHLHFSGLPLRLTFASFKQGSTQSLDGLCLGQHAVNKVNPRSSQHVEERVLEKAESGRLMHGILIGISTNYIYDV